MCAAGAAGAGAAAAAAGAAAVVVGAEAVEVGADWGCVLGASLCVQPTNAKATMMANAAMIADIFFNVFHLLSHPELTTVRPINILYK